jgi:hypothetical protein
MFYTIYKIINTINGKIYIGCHKTSDLDDGYMGSGKILKRAQEKYGIENFQKEILEVFDNPETMFEMEAKLVNSEFVDRDDTYNLKEGGSGGFDYININSINAKNITSGNSKQLSKLAHIVLEALFEDDDWVEERYKKMVETTFKNNGSDAFKKFKGKKHSDESRKKMSQTKKDMNFQKGESNSQFGSMWIHNLKLKESKKIKKDDFSDWEAKGWLKGRKMKFL